MIPVKIIVSGRRSKKIYEFGLPEDWGEVRHDKVPEILSYLYAHAGDLWRARTLILASLTELPVKILNRLDIGQLYDLVHALDWMELAANYKAPFKSFKVAGTTYHLPKAKFQNGSALEYAIADDFYNQYLESRNEEALLRLVATLCRPAKSSLMQIQKTGDVRISLESRSQAEFRAIALKDMPKHLAASVLLYFAGCKKYIHELYADWLFAGPASDEEADADQEQSSAGEGPMFGWWGTFMDIAEGGVFGTLDQVHQTNLHTLCIYLVRKAKEARDRQRQMELERAKHNRS